MKRHLDVQGEWMRGNCGQNIGFIWRVSEMEMWSDICMYKATGLEGIVEAPFGVLQGEWLRYN